MDCIRLPVRPFYQPQRRVDSLLILWSQTKATLLTIFPADEGPRSTFLPNRQWQKTSSAVAWTRRLLRRSDNFIAAFFLSR
jgi:hypothetical protein